MSNGLSVAGPEPASATVEATCGICGGLYSLDMKGSYREGALCTHCGSSGRSQSIAYALTHYVFQQETALNHVEKQKRLKTVGLSDGPAYAKTLAKKMRLYEYLLSYGAFFGHYQASSA